MEQENDSRPIKFILYSRTNEKTIKDNAGSPEYSYYHILKSYLPFLKDIGDVEIVYDPENEVDQIYRQCVEIDQPCLFLHFSAPQNFIPGLSCPTVHVIAWEYTTVPTEAWADNDNDDWRVAFNNTVGTIAISSHTVDVIRETMGADYPTAAIPCPVWDDMARFRDQAPRQPKKNFEIEFEGVLIDSWAMDLKVYLPTEEELQERYRREDEQMVGLQETAKKVRQQRRELEADQAALANKKTLVADEQATLQKERTAIDAQKADLDDIRKTLNTEQRSALDRLQTLQQSPSPLRKFIMDFHSGDWATLEHTKYVTFDSQRLAFKTLAKKLLFCFSLARAFTIDHIFKRQTLQPGHEPRIPADVIDTIHTENTEDTWTADEEQQALSLGDADLKQVPGNKEVAEENTGVETSTVPSPKEPIDDSIVDAILSDGESPESDEIVRNTVRIEGITYLAFINPHDGRKNWQDMVVAFCWAFRDVSDACLILKISAQHVVLFADELVEHLRRLTPFKCRVVAIDAYLDRPTYDELFEGATFYVNTSYGEGQSIPLCEALSAGIPAITSDHTAMRDYVSETSCFIFESTAQITHWQHDARRAYRCLHYRPVFLSLIEQYQKSYEVANEEFSRYKSMRGTAIKNLERHCSIKTVKQNFYDFLQDLKDLRST